MGLLEDLQIDVLTLDKECAEQPGLLGEWAQQYPEAMFKRDKAKQNYKVLIANTELSIRQNPEMFGLNKITEAAVTAVLNTHPEVIEAEDQYLEAVKEFELIKAGRLAFLSRDTQLTNLTTLYKSSYYTTNTEAQIQAEEKAAIDLED